MVADQHLECPDRVRAVLAQGELYTRLIAQKGVLPSGVLLPPSFEWERDWDAQNVAAELNAQ